ncbi:hypothetical protein WAI453_009599 [Rhynchosporium graminicola]
MCGIMMYYGPGPYRRLSCPSEKAQRLVRVDRHNVPENTEIVPTHFKRNQGLCVERDRNQDSCAAASRLVRIELHESREIGTGLRESARISKQHFRKSRILAILRQGHTLVMLSDAENVISTGRQDALEKSNLEVQPGSSALQHAFSERHRRKNTASTMAT